MTGHRQHVRRDRAGQAGQGMVLTAWAGWSKRPGVAGIGRTSDVLVASFEKVTLKLD